MRRNNSHSWIKDDSDEDVVSEGEESDEIKSEDGIQKWRESIGMSIASNTGDGGGK